MIIMKDDYSDIINLEHPEPDPVKHPRMSARDRAAQFAPFAALKGYEEVIDRNREEYEENSE